MSKILMVTNDVVARRMAGPAIRCYELSRQLALAGHEVTLVAEGTTAIPAERVSLLRSVSSERMAALARQHDAIFVQGLSLRQYPSLSRAHIPLVVDLYDPFPLALLEQEKQIDLDLQWLRYSDISSVVREMLEAGDFFVCASQRQRDLWIGALMSVGRINPKTWATDESLRRLIDVVPFGLPSEPPSRRGATLPTEMSEGDVVALWGGGIYNWFDPLTLIRAVARVVPVVPNLKLVFMSSSHPNPGVPPRMWMPARAQQEASALGLLGRHVIFNEEWVPYDQRADWLLSASCGVSTHFNHAETRYSFRTRILDYLWAGLPIITTEGDVLADVVQAKDLGWTVPAQDVERLAEALEEMAVDAPRRAQIAERIDTVARDMTWSSAAEPLVRFCQRPERAADARESRRLNHGRASPPKRFHWALLRLGVSSLREQGVGSTFRRVRRWLRARDRA